MNGGVSEASPEFFGVAVEGGAAGDEGPEFPSELAMDAAENPPAMQEVFAFGGAKFLPELFCMTFVFEIALDFFFEGLQYAGHRDQHGDTLPVDSRDYFGGFERVLEYHCASHQLGEEDSEKLSEDVA